MFDAVTYAAAVAAAKKSAGGDGVYYVGLYSSWKEIIDAFNDGLVLQFSDEITINTPLGDVALWLQMQGANYVDFTPLGGGEELSFSNAYDATGNPAFGKVMLFTVYFRPDSEPETRVTYINPAT